MKGNLPQMQEKEMEKIEECLFFKLVYDLESAVYCLYLFNKNHPNTEPWNSPTFIPSQFWSTRLSELPVIWQTHDCLGQKKDLAEGKGLPPPRDGGRTEYWPKTREHVEGAAPVSWRPRARVPAPHPPVLGGARLSHLHANAAFING